MAGCSQRHMQPGLKSQAKVSRRGKGTEGIGPKDDENGVIQLTMYMATWQRQARDGGTGSLSLGDESETRGTNQIGASAIFNCAGGQTIAVTTYCRLLGWRRKPISSVRRLARSLTWRCAGYCDSTRWKTQIAIYNNLTQELSWFDSVISSRS